jgi:threonylcarbamoyladenosine tRNA methylthiotransferase MtaB
VPRFYIENFGCRASQADGAAIELQLRDNGLTSAESPQQAELVILNSCTVTDAADSSTRAAIRRVHLSNPGCQIVVTGCYAQRAPEEIAALPGVSRVIGNSHKHLLAELAAPALPGSFVPLASLTSDDRVFVSDIFAHTDLPAAPVFAGQKHTRPILKVQDGCNNRCSFCIIPSVRGRSRSLDLDQVLREVNSLVESGYREVVISGINLGRWGKDLVGPRASEKRPWMKSSRDAKRGAEGMNRASPPAHGSGEPVDPSLDSAVPSADSRYASGASHFNLESLIREILDRTAIEKLRISSVEPMDWSDALIRLMARSPRIAKHAHVPLQSGSDRVLRLMHRKYRPWHYREKIAKIRTAMPTAAIGADVMVGFPGESESDFDATCSLIDGLPLTYLHVFTYSSRPGTRSAGMPDPVSALIARERSRILRQLGSEKKLAFMGTFVGKTVEAITLNAFDGEYTEALTDNYLKLRLRRKLEPNQTVIAEIGSVNNETLWSISFKTRCAP